MKVAPVAPVAESVRLEPAQTEAGALTVGAAGVEVTVTGTVLALEVQPLSVCVTE